MAAEKIAYITADEYLKMKNLPERCELIDGAVIVMSPSPSYRHQKISVILMNKIFNYIRKNNGGCEIYHAPSDVRLDDENVVQPDIFVTCHPEKINGHIHDGAPDWVIEIVSPSSSSMDYIKKCHLYKKSGVREYWIVNPLDDTVAVYLFGEENGDAVTYSFSDSIPVYIYAENDEPLEIALEKFIETGGTPQ